MRKKRMVKIEPDREEIIRANAYHKWEQAGRPPGDGLEFWVEAERDYAAQNGQVEMLREALEEEQMLAVSSA